ncbi:hypothetical protein [Chryseobacterium indologenes]|uniref:hypothetical protein n=1 Tax=Chryseobacterium indologenes TaxID=253 RepID=UPI004059829C
MASNFPDILTNKKDNEKKPEFRNVLFNLDKNIISNDNVEHLMTIYNSAKQLDIRNKILKLLYDFTYPLLKDFFLNAYKKERYLDMKIYALRGLSNFIKEKEITQLLKKFNQSLAKRQQTTPYNFQEYELLKGGNALPYLVEKYGYPCFKETLEQVNRQYEAMPDAFKGHYTIDDNGDIKMLKNAGESKAIMDRFWEEERSKLK